MPNRVTSLVSPLGDARCRALFAAQLISGLGDWAGRLALSVLIYERSSSVVLSAAVVVVSLLPWLGPGQLIATLADRYGRIRVMTYSDYVRAAVFVSMLLPQPVWSLLVAAFVAGLCVPPFAAARSSAIVDVTDAETYPRMLSLYGVLDQAEIIIGYLLAAGLTAFLGPRPALLLNATTFLASAALLRTLRSSAAASPNPSSSVGWAGVRSGAAIWRTDPYCRRALLLFVGTSMFTVMPEALVVPLTAQSGLPVGFTGVFAAAGALGAIAAVALIPDLTDHGEILRRAATRALVPAIAAAALFAALLADLPLLPLFAVSAYVVAGLTDAIAVQTNRVVGERLPQAGRAASMSVAMGVLYGSHAIGISLGALIAESTGARAALSGAMLLTAATCMYAALRPVREFEPVPGPTRTAAPVRSA